MHTKFARFAITDDITTIIDRENIELQQAAWEAASSQDDSEPFVAMAQRELEDRQTRAVQQQKLLKISQDSVKHSSPPEAVSTSIISPVPLPAQETVSAWDDPCVPQSLPPISNNTPKEWAQEMEELRAKDLPTEVGEVTTQEQPVPTQKTTTRSKLEKSIEIPDDFYYFYQCT